MMLHNTGQDITYNLTSGHVTLSGGPLSYEYQLFGAMIKFGRNSARGSEHHINGVPFPGEVSFAFFSSLRSRRADLRRVHGEREKLRPGWKEEEVPTRWKTSEISGQGREREREV